MMTFLLIAVPAWSQVPPSPPSDAQEVESSSASEDRRSGRSFIGGILENSGRRVGFSVYVSHAHTQDNAASSNEPRVSSFTAVQPRLFGQFEGRRHTVAWDYSFGYRRYTGAQAVGSTEQSASITLEKPLSTRVSLRLSDAVNSYFNDNRTALVGGGSAADLSPYSVNFGQDVYIPHQRVTTNTLTANLSYQWSRRSGISAFATHEYWLYSDPDLRDLQTVQVGIGGNYQLNRWMYWDMGYSTYVNTVDENLRTASIQRLQLAGLRYQTENGFSIFGNGGGEYSRSLGINQLGASFHGGVSKTSGTTSMSLSYHRGFTSTNDRGLVLSGNDFTASVRGQPWERVTVNFTSVYLRGVARSNDVGIDAISGYGSVGIAIHQHLQVSVGYSQINQRTRNLPGGNESVSRYAVSAGLNYFLPSLYRR
jgi:hypothetical protein